MRLARPSRLVCSVVASGCVALVTPARALGFQPADTRGDGTGAELRWDASEPVAFRMHFAGSSEIAPLNLQLLMREAFGSWAEVASADLGFEEGHVFVGSASHHLGPSEVDGESAIFFVEAQWPHGPQVIALTSVSFQADGTIVDADIAFNGADHAFTTGDSEIVKDFLSIATHEVGHFLGLSHSAGGEATMFAEYLDGDTSLRDLASDDVEGVSYLYPCGFEPCENGVTWVDSGAACATSGDPPGVGFAALGLLGWAFARRRVARRLRVLGVALTVGLAAVLAAAPASSSLVLAIPLAELARGGDRVVRGEVLSAEGTLDGIVKTRVLLRVDEDLLGGGEELVEIEVLGGLLDVPQEVFTADGTPRPQRIAGTLVFGAPRMQVGEEVVVILDAAASGPMGVRGLAQGLFRVEPDGTLTQDLRGLAFARSGGRSPLPIQAPRTLAALRDEVRGAR